MVKTRGGWAGALLLSGRNAAGENGTVTPLLYGVLLSPEALANFSLFLLEKEKNVGFQIRSGNRQD